MSEPDDQEAIPSCQQSDSNQTISLKILYSDAVDPNGEYWPRRAADYQRAYPHVNITLERIEGGFSPLDQRLKEDIQSGISTWDAASIPAQFTGDLVGMGVLMDLSEFVHESTILRWEEIFPFYRAQVAVYDSKVWLIPLDGDSLMLFYRQDLFDEFGVQVPRTWSEYTEAARFFHGKPLGPNNTMIFGSCISRVKQCANSYWASLVLSSMTQANATSSGFMFDPENMDPLLGEAMEETLRILDEQSKYGHENEFEGGCLAVGNDMNLGRCALVYDWGNLLSSPDSPYLPYGITRTPGSTRVFDRSSGKLVNCTKSTCPYARIYDDIGLVNSPTYAAFGGWAGAVSSVAPNEKQRAAAEFLSWLSNSNQSLSDVIPNDEQSASFAQPYRRAHARLSPWTSGPGRFDEVTATRFTDAVDFVNELNTAIELRIPLAENFRQILDRKTYQFLAGIHRDGNLTGDLVTRKVVTRQIERQFREIITAYDVRNADGPLIDSYQKSLGLYLRPPLNNNLIGNVMRSFGWLFAFMICISASIAAIWVLRNRKTRVIEASQPGLLLQMAAGIFLIGLAMVSLGFDDEILNEEVLDSTCMMIPWLYAMGFCTLMSPVLAKLWILYSLYHHPEDSKLLEVSKRLLATVCALIFGPNLASLVAWTIIDPLFWERTDTNDEYSRSEGRRPDTFGRCTSISSKFPIYAGFLVCFDLLICVIGMAIAARCRRIRVEFKEPRWLAFVILPFVELWVVGGVVVFLTLEEPVGLYVLLLLVMGISVLIATLSIFWPKYRYLKKEKKKKEESHRGNPQTTPTNSQDNDIVRESFESPSRGLGPRMLSHPKVETAEAQLSLKSTLQSSMNSNLRLETEIRDVLSQLNQGNNRSKTIRRISNSLKGNHSQRQ